MAGRPRKTPKRRVSKEHASRLLQEWMRENRLTQDDLADQLGVAQTSVSQWLSGHAPLLRHALAIHELTRIPPTAWMA